MQEDDRRQRRSDDVPWREWKGAGSLGRDSFSKGLAIAFCMGPRIAMDFWSSCPWAHETSASRSSPVTLSVAIQSMS